MWGWRSKGNSSCELWYWNTEYLLPLLASPLASARDGRVACGPGYMMPAHLLFPSPSVAKSRQLQRRTKNKINIVQQIFPPSLPILPPPHIPSLQSVIVISKLSPTLFTSLSFLLHSRYVSIRAGAIDRGLIADANGNRTVVRK